MRRDDSDVVDGLLKEDCCGKTRDHEDTWRPRFWTSVRRDGQRSVEIRQTSDEFLIFSHASPYSTVGEFLENSSEVRA